MNSRHELRRARRHTHLSPFRPSVQKQLAGAAARAAKTRHCRGYHKHCCQPAQTLKLELNILLSPDCGHQKALSIVRHRSTDSAIRPCTTVTSRTTKFEKEHSNEVKAHMRLNVNIRSAGSSEPRVKCVAHLFCFHPRQPKSVADSQ